MRWCWCCSRAIVAGAAWGTQTYLNTAAYLANDNGKVAVYRGVPGSVLGLSFSHLERTTDVTVADLQPGVANRLNEGIRVDDMEAADALVKEYEDEIAARSKNQAEGRQRRKRPKRGREGCVGR